MKTLHPIFAIGRTDVADKLCLGSTFIIRFEGSGEWFELDS
jgi:hypothetical protein